MAYRKDHSLFDSLANGYPIGTFLFWEARSETTSGVVFNSFINEYHERKSGIANRGTRVELQPGRTYSGVLDGQQRLTSLYLGLCGTFKTHIKRKDWSSPESFEDSVLCVDILAFLNSYEEPQDPDADGEMTGPYSFKLLAIPSETKTDSPIRKLVKDEDGAHHYWLPLSDFLEKDQLSINTDINSKCAPLSLDWDSGLLIQNHVMKLTTAFQDTPAINYFSTSRDIWDVLDIFVRVNTGGQALQASDLILSIASASKGEDIQANFQNAITSISSAGGQNTSFKPDKDLLLRAALMFTGASSLYLNSSSNRDRPYIDRMLENWKQIVDALREAGVYLEKIGFDARHLTTPNVVLPIAYYFYLHEIQNRRGYALSSNAAARKDRILIRQWVLRAMLKGIFGDSIPNTLLTIRKRIDEANEAGEKGFPFARLVNLSAKKSLVVSDEDIEDMMSLRYGDSRVQPLFITITSCDTHAFSYDVDHIWAQSKFDSINSLTKALGGDKARAKEYQAAYNTLPNLQLLTDVVNREKYKSDYGDWLLEVFPTIDARKTYFSQCLIPEHDFNDYSFEYFLEFCEERKELLRAAIKKALPDTVADISLKEADLAFSGIA